MGEIQGGEEEGEGKRQRRAEGVREGGSGRKGREENREGGG